jgi:hypothetical protein
MRALVTVAMAALVGGLVSSQARAWWDTDSFDTYLQRSDTITLGAGNAKEVNGVTHMITPWPPYAFDRRIPGNGARQVGAVQRYENPSRIRQAPCPSVPVFDPSAEGGTGRTQTASGQCGAGGINAGGIAGGAPFPGGR